jgi:HlyD family secretion protein
VKPDSVLKDKPLLKPSGRWAITAVVLASLAVSGAAFQYVFHFRRSSPNSSSSSVRAPSSNTVAALGRLRPEGEVIHLSAPSALPGVGSSRVAQLLVDEGEAVKAGQVVAILDNYETLQTGLQVAQEDVKIAQASLAQVKAGAKTGAIAAQQATIARLKADLQGQLVAQDQLISRLGAELHNAQIEYQRYLDLFQNGAVTASQLDSKRLAQTTARTQLSEVQADRNRTIDTFREQIRAAQSTLDEIAEVRPTDIQVAEAEVDRAIAAVRKAQADYDQALIRSSIDGQVLNIYSRPGELVGDQGIIAVGKTDQMNVIAEVYELDVGKLQLGQTARVTNSLFPETLYGTVTQIGIQVNPQDVLSTEPTANVDRRIVEVEIRLNQKDSQRVSNLTNLQVNVFIDI